MRCPSTSFHVSVFWGFSIGYSVGGVGLLVREALVSQRVLGKLDNRLAVNDGTARFKTVVILMNVI